MSTIRSRLLLIAGLLVLSVWQLMPTNVTERVPDKTTGRMKDTTVRRVPIDLGLDLQGGIHLALEVDQSKGPVPDCADAIQRAERVVRTRIDEFRTTEMKNVFRDALPEIDKALRRAGVKAPGQAAPAATVTQLFGTDTAKAKGKAAKAKAAAKDTSDANAPGPLASVLFQSPSNIPGEFLVPEEQVPVAESLLVRPDVERLVPRGIEFKWGTEVLSRAGRSD